MDDCQLRATSPSPLPMSLFTTNPSSSCVMNPVSSTPLPFKHIPRSLFALTSYIVTSLPNSGSKMSKQVDEKLAGCPSPIDVIF
ncbi:hypothetical protein DM01DRAFT_1339105 [Hesseltinella vesiculosa]|uniref:Uncharacterized protein n=1 Tax=Hesseltinella vesiculosa TaxID=101127 RepID=A0A1X2G870_9FUNG|nr:hypothetical protein DM01DRAFT_1339105 [Hesseltinella vesiculosa]